MEEARDTILRQWNMLRLIPREPRAIGTAALCTTLKDEGFRVDVRTIQRDLEKLSGSFPLQCDTKGKAKHWYWTKEGRVMDIPGIDPPTALAFLLAKEYLAPLLPQTTLRHLQPHFEAAQNILQAKHKNKLGLWPEKVCRIGRGPDLLAPTIRPEVHETINQALLEDRQVEVWYQRKNRQQPKTFPVNPLGLVFLGGVVYLVCTAREYEEIIKLALHRMSAAKLLDGRCHRPTGFNLHAYVKEDQEFAYPLASQPIRLRALFGPKAVTLFTEQKLSPNQRVTVKEDGRVLLNATVKDTLELRWWLKSFGDKVEILGPKSLRDEFKRIAERMAQLYSKAH